jgi:hypothetical protein
MKEAGKMKKSLLIAAAFLLAANMALYGQIITVTSPAASANWCIGSPYTITWTKSGTMPDTVAIRLRRAGSPESELAAWNLTDSTPNDGSYGPVTVPASVPAGDYFIRVRTSSPDVIGNSGIFHISSCTPASASITVTSPTAGNDWVLGTTHTITWTKSGTMPANVAVRLRRAGAPEAELAVVNITDSTANDGSLSWPIPASVPAGDYFIRVRTSSPDVIGDSAVFSLTNFTIAEIVIIPDLRIIPRSDLELAGVGVEYDGTRIVAWVRNNGPDALANRDVKFRLNFPERAGGEQIFTRQLTIPVGQERSVPMVVMDASVFPDSGLRTSVAIDTGLSRINDPNRLNQHRDVRLCVLDIRCDLDNLRLARVYSYTFRDLPFKVTYSIHVRHNLPRTVNNIRVKREYHGPAGLLSGHGVTGTYTIPALAAGEVWTKDIEMRFGEEGESHTDQPKISKGTTYQIVAGIDDPGNAFCDTIPRNDTARLNFRFPD